MVMVSIDVNTSILNAVRLVRGQIEPHTAQLEIDLASGLPTIRGSESHLEDLWVNLLLNARDAVMETPEGRIQVQTILADEAYIEINISDNGQGIAPEHLERVFDPFFTTKERGVGLGLALCHDIAAAHGGSISVESNERKGTTFSTILPIS